MGIIIGLIVTLGCVLGGFMAMGGHIEVLIQPWEVVIICGAAFGTFLVANPMKTVKDTGKGIIEAFKQAVPKETEYLEVLGVLHSLMRELRTKSRNEVEAHIDNPEESSLFQAYPSILKNKGLMYFICDYCRLIIIGNAKSHEIEALMDEEIQTIKHDRLKAYQALNQMSDGFPAIGICAAVLGVVKAMGALDQSPEILGGLIGAAMVGTFAGIFVSYGIMTPLAYKVKVARSKECHVYLIIKQTLLAFMNGALPQVAIEHGRKSIPSHERPSIDEVESETLNGAGPAAAEAA